MADKNLVIRLSLQDSETVRTALLKLGDDGQAALQRLEAGGRSAADGLTATSDAAGASHGAIATATREFRALFDELSSGRIRQTPGTLAIIATRVLGIGGAALGVGAAVLGIPLAFTAMAVKAQQDFSAVDLAIKGTGDAVGLTHGQIDQLATDVAEKTGQSVTSVREQATALVATGQVTAQSLAQILGLSRDYAVITGQELPAANAKLLAAFAGQMSGLVDLNNQFHFLDAAQLDHIQRLQQSGQAQDATTEATKLFADRVSGATEQLGLFARAWNAVKTAASAAMAAIGSIGVPETAEAKLDRLKKELAAMEQAPKDRSGAPAGPFIFGGPHPESDDAGTAKLQSLRAQVASQQKVVDDGQAAAKADAEKVALQQQGIAADALAKSIRSLAAEKEKLETEETKLKSAISAGVGNLDLERAALQHVQVQLGNLQGPYEKLITSMKQSVASAGLDGEAAKEEAAEQRARAAAVSEGIPFTEKMAADVRALADAEYNAAAAAKASEQATKDEQASIEAHDKAIRSLQEASAQGELQRRQTLAGMQQEIADNKDLLAAAQQSAAAYAAKRAEIQALQALGPDATPEQIQQAKDYAAVLQQQTTELDNIKQATNDWKTLTNDLDRIGADTFEKLIMDGKNWRQTLQGAAQDIAQLILKLEVIKPLEQALHLDDSATGGSGGSSGGGFGGSLFSWLGSLLSGGSGAGEDAAGAGLDSAGVTGLGSAASGFFDASGLAFAGGGDPPVGVPSLVGEEGPELFIPKTAGTIVPNGQLGGSVHFHHTVNIDARGADSSVDQRLRAWSSEIRKQTQRDTIRQMQQGGKMSKLIGRRS